MKDKVMKMAAPSTEKQTSAADQFIDYETLSQIAYGPGEDSQIDHIRTYFDTFAAEDCIRSSIDYFNSIGKCKAKAAIWFITQVGCQDYEKFWDMIQDVINMSDTVEDQLSEKNAQIGHLQEQVRDLNSSNEALKTKLLRADEKVEGLKASIADNEAKATSIRAEMSKANADMDNRVKAEKKAAAELAEKIGAYESVIRTIRNCCDSISLRGDSYSPAGYDTDIARQEAMDATMLPVEMLKASVPTGRAKRPLSFDEWKNQVSDKLFYIAKVSGHSKFDMQNKVFLYANNRYKSFPKDYQSIYSSETNRRIFDEILDSYIAAYTSEEAAV